MAPIQIVSIAYLIAKVTVYIPGAWESPIAATILPILCGWINFDVLLNCASRNRLSVLLLQPRYSTKII
jgi:hypothetical protein